VEQVGEERDAQFGGLEQQEGDEEGGRCEVGTAEEEGGGDAEELGGVEGRDEGVWRGGHGKDVGGAVL